MQNPQIVNIINFVRGVEPRDPALDLVKPVREQLRLLQELKLPSTFLIQYDALLNPEIVSLLQNAGGHTEIGLWLEIVQPQVEAAGLSWRGRPGFAWDWHANVGFSVGYTPKERKMLIDEAMRKFHEVFGRYPESVGSWVIDAVSLRYLSEKYHIAASCNCRDQWGTDGYTIWGGFYMGGYYPSVKNMLFPAKTQEDRIPVPTFRMLGSDPVYQYDLGLKIDEAAADWQSVLTLEPCAPEGGGNPAWIDWFFKQTYNGICCSHAYCQSGQENSFGWDVMKDGLGHQFPRIAELAAQGKLLPQTLAESGKWYSRQFAVTAPVASFADGDYKGLDKKSLWYCCKNYRINLYAENGKFWIRDLFKFDSSYPERYLEAVCDSEVLHFDNLPLVDGNRGSGNGVRSGFYPLIDGECPVYEAFSVTGTDTAVTAKIRCKNADFVFYADEYGFKFTCSRPFTMRFDRNSDAPDTPALRIGMENLFFEHHGHAYRTLLSTGSIIPGKFPVVAHSVSDTLSFRMCE